MEKMEVKVGLKMKRHRVINERKNEWGVVNGEGKEARRQAVLRGVKGGEEEEEGGWQDVEGGDDEEEVVGDDAVALPAVPAQLAQAEAATTNGVAVDETVNEEDKIT